MLVRYLSCGLWQQILDWRCVQEYFVNSFTIKIIYESQWCWCGWWCSVDGCGCGGGGGDGDSDGSGGAGGCSSGVGDNDDDNDVNVVVWSRDVSLL